MTEEVIEEVVEVKPQLPPKVVLQNSSFKFGRKKHYPVEEIEEIKEISEPDETEEEVLSPPPSPPKVEEKTVLPPPPSPPKVEEKPVL